MSPAAVSFAEHLKTRPTFEDITEDERANLQTFYAAGWCNIFAGPPYHWYLTGVGQAELERSQNEN